MIKMFRLYEGDGYSSISTVLLQNEELIAKLAELEPNTIYFFAEIVSADV